MVLKSEFDSIIQVDVAQEYYSVSPIPSGKGGREPISIGFKI